MIRISAKTGVGVDQVLDAIVDRIPPPAGDRDAPPRALIFDSSYDDYRGVIAFVRVVDGSFEPRTGLKAMALGTEFEAQELGYMSPSRIPVQSLEAGEVGYIVTGLKDVSRAPRRRHADDAQGGARPRPSPGTRTSSRWCSRGCSRATPTTTPSCVTRSRS